MKVGPEYETNKFQSFIGLCCYNFEFCWKRFHLCRVSTTFNTPRLVKINISTTLSTLYNAQVLDPNAYPLLFSLSAVQSKE